MDKPVNLFFFKWRNINMLTDFVFVCFWKKKKQSQLYLLKLLKLVNQNMTKFYFDNWQTF